MKKVFQILPVFVGIIFMISTNGILIYKTYCVCTGNEQVSLYVMPESCVEEFHVHHSHTTHGCEIETSESCCHECSTINDGCGCESPKVEFFKIVNQISEEEIPFLTVKSVKILDSFASLLIGFDEEVDNNNPVEIYTDPPPKISNSKSFLIEVHQLKIPDLA
jgi:hypothetical protein